MQDIKDNCKTARDIIKKELGLELKETNVYLIDDDKPNHIDWDKNIYLRKDSDIESAFHEELHKISYEYRTKEKNIEIYVNNREIEEATVTLLAEELCKKYNYQIHKTGYDKMVNDLRKINSYIKPQKTDLEFAKELIHIRLEKRGEWLLKQMLNSLD